MSCIFIKMHIFIAYSLMLIWDIICCKFTKEIYIKIKRSEIAHRFRNFTQNSHIII